MKQFFLAITSLVYFAVASGFVLNVHYCMGKQTGIGYSYRENDKCGKCGMENKKGCCHSEFRLVKLTDDQQMASVVTAPLQFSVVVPSVISGMPDLFAKAGRLFALTVHSPPDRRLSEVYLYNCTFRI